jgi:eukaryotic-like serine/threonine-protein kinase
MTELIGGRYEVGELLGRGGMAEVRKGTDQRLGRTVAIKRLRHDLASDATFQARFRREAQSSASLNHPSIVAVYDTGEETAADGVHQPYIVMEYVAGRTLRDILREGRKILPERALEITSDVLSALDYSHRAGIIHRDIKPGNVMLTPTGDVKVMDFGIARAVSDAQSTMTQTAAVVGTAQYLSPEQARGETVDSRSDVYSAGCLLYELLTGRPPFVGDSPVAVAYQHVREQPSPPSDHDTALPAQIDAIVLKSLAKRVEDRYQSAAAMRDDIERYLAGRPVSVAPAPAPSPVPLLPTPATTTVAAAPPSATEPAAYEEYQEPEGPSRPPVGLIIGLIILVLALIALAAFGLPKLFNNGPDQKAVPDLVGKSEQQARDTLAADGFQIGQVVSQPDARQSAGNVIKQDPTGGVGSYADAGTAVDLWISTGLPRVGMPDVTGHSYDDAKAQLTGSSYGFTVAPPTWVASDEARGTVVSQDPAAGGTGTYVAGPSTKVTLTVSKGPRKMPNVVGLSIDQAEQQIDAAGFTVGQKNAVQECGKGYNIVTAQLFAGKKEAHGTPESLQYNTCAAPPKLRNDAASTTSGTTVTVDVLKNDKTSDPAVTLDPSTLTLVDPTSGQPAPGVVQVVGQGIWSVKDGKVVFEPDPTFVGATQITYQVTDTAKNTATAVVTVTVAPPTAPPPTTPSDDTGLGGTP